MTKIQNNAIVSSGVLIVNKQSKILLIKPKGLSEGQYSLPKGIVNSHEELKQAAIRETYEEIGLQLKEKELGKQYVVHYFNKGILTKKVFCYLVKISVEQEKNFIPILQEEEVEFCGFFSKEEFKKIVFWRYRFFEEIEEIWK